MTKINKMVMHGFKSFAKYTEILFGDKFNCVLGPNGSGKSNVLDALCFVLGKSSAKSLRAEKSSNLIYNGGKSKNPAKQGEVSIFFDNKNKIFPMEEEEIKISRIVKQSGQSVYKINDKPVTRTQVLDLLTHGKINPDGYNIILQGDIVRFVEMPPNDRRELIGEIAGIGVYDEKKNKALKQLEKVDERLKEADIVLTERKMYLKELKKDRDQALKFKEMHDKVREYKASLLKLQIDKKENEKTDFNKKLEETKQDLQKANERINKLKSDSEEKKKSMESISLEIEQKGEVEQVKLNREVEALKINLTKHTARIENVKNEIKKILQRKEDLKVSNAETDTKVQDLESKKNELGEQLDKITKEKTYFEDKIKKFKEKHNLEEAGSFEKEVEEIDKKSEILQKDIHELREQQHNLLREKAVVEHKENSVDEAISKVKELEKEHKQQLDELQEKRETFKKATLDLNKRLDEDTSLAASLNDVRQRLKAANEELAKLEVRQVGLKEHKLGDVAIKRIIEQKNKIGGIFGTVAELGDVNAKYALALEVAAGSRIKSIVVESDKIAADCIRYLKENKLGTATFLPLNKIKEKPSSQEIKKLAKADGTHGLAIDLVDYDPKFKKVFSHVFADTIVVDTIDVARRLGIGNAKMVTLDGDSAERSGAMIGGYRQKDKRGIGFKEKELTKDLEKAEENITELQNLIQTLEKRREENELKIQNLREDKASLEGDIIRTEKSLHLDSGDIELSRKKKEELANDIKALEEKIEKIQETISDMNNDLAQLKIKRQEFRSNIMQLRDPTKIAELNTFEEKIKQFTEETISINADIKNFEEQIKGIFGPEVEKTKAIIKQLDKEEEDFNKEIIELKSLMETEDGELAGKEQKAKAFYTQFKELFSKRTAFQEEINKNDNSVNNKLDESRRVEIRMNTLSLKVAEFNAALSGLQQEFDQYEGVKISTEKNEEQLKYQLNRFEKMKEEVGSVNMRALDIYEEVEKEFNSLVGKKDGLAAEKEDVVILMEEIELRKKDMFMETFVSVNENFKNNFNLLSTKGEATLRLENPENPFEGGAEIVVRITGNKFLDIRSLSGGEKTITALAFIFSIQDYEPASFYVLDEVDAALDKTNSEKLSQLINKYADHAQYILISHKEGVITAADTLYGISMNTDGMSKVVSLKI